MGRRRRVGSMGVAKADRNLAEARQRAADVGPPAPVRLEPAACFYSRLSQSYSTDIDLERVLRAQCKAHRGIEL